MAVQDGLDDILQSRSLPDDLVAPGHLPAKRLCRLVRNPDFRQKAACIKLREDAGVDRIGFNLRMGDDANLLGVCDHDLLDVRRNHRRNRRRVAGRFDDNHVLLGELLRESLKKMAAHVDAPQPFELAVVPGDRLGEGAVNIQSDDPHACSSVSVRSKRELAGDTTSTDPRSRRIRESRKGGHVTSSGSRPTVYRRPARTFVLPAPRVPDGLTISPAPFREQPDREAPPISYRIMSRSNA